FAVFNEEKNKIFCLKRTGRVDVLENEIKNSNFSSDLSGSPSIFHTRWATHGQVSDANAHPHSDCQENIFLAHNGIIENYKELKEILEKEGHKFKSETDTEVIAHLIEKHFEGNLETAVRKALKLVKGTYGLVVIARDDPQKMVAAKLSSPLLIGANGEEYIVASDPNAIAPFTKKVIYLDDNEMAVITPKDILIMKEKQLETLEIDAQEAQKKGYPHFMLKEIMEQPESLENTLKGRLLTEEGLAKLGGLDSIENKLREIERINIIACGTARHAGLVGEYILEEYAGILTKVDAASEFRYRKPILDKKTLIVAISQSGETADTLAAIKEAKSKGILTLGITNVVGSTQTREVDAGIYTHAGPEIGVASTKAYTSQLVVLALLALYLGRQRQLSLVMGQRIARELSKIPELIKEVLKNEPKIKELAVKYKNFDNFLYLGRKYNYATAREGAHKIKETAYTHAEGCRGGEPKHCEIALISENFPSVCVVPSDSVYEKMVSNIQEIKARKGPVIAIATEGNEDIKNIADDVIYIPKTLEMLTPILAIVPLQLFAYHVAVLRGCDVDKPRNLAKSVTVE
ncbi:MAG: glutamine--fructose-6-phosphate transaminase (isomerizing), partial [Candidatus Nealsonbacteria bacterium]|nr:glutamine--fructose-6-phosphate transaminase (isomerizing) [Candidatus Nealsonbacteria bacterium]